MTPNQRPGETSFNSGKYIIVDGTAFEKLTNDKVIHKLNRLIHKDTRIKIVLGDPFTGKSWNETHDTTGYVRRSSGKLKVPILLYNKRSYGGGAILTANILQISFANKNNGSRIYKHPRYKGN